MENVDLGVCAGQLFPGDSDEVAVLLPGARYVPAAPLLWFAREVLQAEGLTVLQVWDEWDRSIDAHQWVADRVEAALSYVGDSRTRLLVAKSLTTLALPTAIELGLAGVWLTPLLNQEEVRAALTGSTVPSLIVGGTGDTSWDSEFVADLSNIEVLEVDGADHGLQYPGDPTRSIEALRTITDRIGQFVGQLT